MRFASYSALPAAWHCNKCGADKPPAQMVMKGGADGIVHLYPICKPCRNRQYRELHSERRTAYLPGLRFFHSVIWDKNNPGLGWRYRRQHEMVIVGHRRGGGLRWNTSAAAAANIIKMSAPRKRAHPNEKPLGLVRHFLERHTNPGDLVLDPFLGSGTTAVAAASLGRHYLGFELAETYCRVARRRLAAAGKGERP